MLQKEKDPRSNPGPTKKLWGLKTWTGTFRSNGITHSNTSAEIVGSASQHTQEMCELEGKIPTSAGEKGCSFEDLQEVHEGGVGDVGTIT